MQKLKISKEKVLPWLLPVIIVGSWEGVIRMNWVTSDLIPAPTTILVNAWSLLKSGQLQENLSVSLYRATLGFLIGGGSGFILGILNGIFKTSRLLLDGTIQMLRNIPHLSLIPLLILFLGIGETSKIVLVAIGCLFPIYVNTYHGITSVDAKLIEMGRSYGMNQRQLFAKVIFPGALPSILMGVRYALGVMWTTLIVAETVSSSSGIGYMANDAQQFTNMDTIMLCIIIYALFGKLSDMIAKNLEDILLTWQQLEVEGS